MPNLDLLGSLMKDLHQEFVRIYYLALPCFFALALVITWMKQPQGSVDFLDVLKRAIISTILLVAFPDIVQAIIFVTDGIAERIDKLAGLDTVLRMAKEKLDTYSLSPKSILLQFNDLIIALLAFVSYLVLYIARYLTIAMYHFYWIFFTISAPLLLLFNLFRGTSQITVNLFKGMIEVACWKVVWAILSAMLAALSFGDAYKAEGNYLVIMVMNFVIAVALLKTPQIVSSLVNGGVQSMASPIGMLATAAMAATPARVVAASRMTRQGLNATKNFAQNVKTRINRPKQAKDPY